jgi:hypothetical protein
MAGTIALQRTVQTLVQEDQELHRIIRDAYDQFCETAGSNWSLHLPQIKKFLGALERRGYIKIPRNLFQFEGTASAKERICKFVRRILFEEGPSLLLRLPFASLHKILSYLDWDTFKKFFYAISVSPRARLIAARYALETLADPLSLSLAVDPEKFEPLARLFLNLVMCSARGITFCQRSASHPFCRVQISDSSWPELLRIYTTGGDAGISVYHKLQSSHYSLSDNDREFSSILDFRPIQEILSIIPGLDKTWPLLIAFNEDVIPFAIHVIRNSHLIMAMFLAELSHRDRLDIDLSVSGLFIDFSNLSSANLGVVDQMLLDSIYSAELEIEQYKKPRTKRARTAAYELIDFLTSLTHRYHPEIVRDLVEMQIYLFDVYRSLIALNVENFSVELTDMPALERKLLTTLFTETFPLTRKALVLSRNLCLFSSRNLVVLRNWHFWRLVVNDFYEYTKTHFISPEIGVLII